jgi:hypothetical protein
LSLAVAISVEDIDQAAAGNLVTKLVCVSRSDDPLASPEFNTLVSTRLEPGVDIVAQAQRRGHVVATLRVGMHSATE